MFFYIGWSRKSFFKGRFKQRDEGSGVFSCGISTYLWRECLRQESGRCKIDLTEQTTFLLLPLGQEVFYLFLFLIRNGYWVLSNTFKNGFSFLVYSYGGFHWFSNVRPTLHSCGNLSGHDILSFLHIAVYTLLKPSELRPNLLGILHLCCKGCGSVVLECGLLAGSCWLVGWAEGAPSSSGSWASWHRIHVSSLDVG